MYYSDLKTGKQRELDVVARQIWKRRSLDVEQLCRITLLVEVKSMAGFHLLLSEHPATSHEFYEHIHWFGDPDGRYLDLSQGLLALGGDQKKIDALVDKAHRYAYPRQRARVWSMMVRPHPVVAFTSFRETNIGADKDLDNSVFWRASQNLKSAHDSIAKSIRETHLDTLLGAAEFERRSKDWINSMLWWTRHQISVVDIIHPVVVTDAQLWSVLEGEPKPRAYARFGSHTYTGGMDWWCDVVNASHFQEYAARLTAHYRKKLRSAKAKLST